MEATPPCRAVGRGFLCLLLGAKKFPAPFPATNSPVRVDGLPSVGRHYTSVRDGQFETRATPGFAPRLGALAMQDADFGGDGREDLLLVTGGAQAPRRAGTHLYRNSRRGLEDVTREMGIRSFGETPRWIRESTFFGSGPDPTGRGPRDAAGDLP